MLAFLKADISLHNCDAIFFTDVNDWPQRLQMIIPEKLLDAQQAVPTWISDMRSKIEKTDPKRAKGVVWEPGKLYCWKGPQKKVIFPCLGKTPDYGAYRDCLQRLQDNWQKFGIKSIAMPRLGQAHNLEWKVIRDMLVHCFAEPNAAANEIPKGLVVEVYEEDIQGRPAK